MKALPNNEKPPPHFIECYKPRGKKIKQSEINNIKLINSYLRDTKELGAKTIAIFKIRLK